MKINEILEENFFIVDSDNIPFIETKLYGYSIYNNKIILNNTLKKDMELMEQVHMSITCKG